jgi:hypothetical protein
MEEMIQEYLIEKLALKNIKVTSVKATHECISVVHFDYDSLNAGRQSTTDRVNVWRVVEWMWKKNNNKSTIQKSRLITRVEETIKNVQKEFEDGDRGFVENLKPKKCLPGACIPNGMYYCIYCGEEI